MIEASIRHGDCLDILHEVEDNTFDLIVTSPPLPIAVKQPMVGFIRISMFPGFCLDPRNFCVFSNPRAHLF